MPAGNPPTHEQRLATRERPGGFPVMRQRWAELLFLHWPIDPAIIQARLPKGLFVDTFDGSAWLGVVPFSMERVHPVLLPPIPLLSWFLELNVRTYVHDAHGNPGVWFFSLDCNQPIAVEIARYGFHLPYEHAAMQRVKNGRHIDYTSRRKAPGETDAIFKYDLPTTAAPAPEHTLEWFLVERYFLFSARRDGSLYTGRVHHPPYRIAQANCEHWSTTPLRLTGFPEPAIPPVSALVADPIDVKIYPLKKLASLSG